MTLMLLFTAVSGESIGWLVRYWYFRCYSVSLVGRQQECTGFARYSSPSNGLQNELLSQLTIGKDARLDDEGRANILVGRLAGPETENSGLMQSVYVKADEIEKSNKNKVSGHTVHLGCSEDQARLLRIEIARRTTVMPLYQVSRDKDHAKRVDGAGHGKDA